jgi:transposase InsO family protein
MCRRLKVSTSGYHAWRSRRPRPRALFNAALVDRIEAIHEASDQVKGSPRICRELRPEGHPCSVKRVARLRRAKGKRGIPRLGEWREKPSAARPAGVDNLLERDFSATACDKRWVIDITYIRTDGNRLYLSIVLDLYSDAVVGWSMGTRQGTELVMRSVLMALGQRGRKGLLRPPEARAGQPAPLPNESGSENGCVRLHRARPRAGSTEVAGAVSRPVDLDQGIRGIGGEAPPPTSPVVPP